ncbi:MAG: hypothetical protein ACM3MG_12925 [Bacillota bacterium]
MIVAMWFIMVGLVILVGFTLVGLTLRHWAQQKKMANENKVAVSK